MKHARLALLAATLCLSTRASAELEGPPVAASGARFELALASHEGPFGSAVLTPSGCERALRDRLASVLARQEDRGLDLALTLAPLDMTVRVRSGKPGYLALFLRNASHLTAVLVTNARLTPGQTATVMLGDRFDVAYRPKQLAGATGWLTAIRTDEPLPLGCGRDRAARLARALDEGPAAVVNHPFRVMAVRLSRFEAPSEEYTRAWSEIAALGPRHGGRVAELAVGSSRPGEDGGPRQLKEGDVILLHAIASEDSYATVFWSGPNGRSGAFDSVALPAGTLVAVDTRAAIVPLLGEERLLVLFTPESLTRGRDADQTLAAIREASSRADTGIQQLTVISVPEWHAP